MVKDIFSTREYSSLGYRRCACLPFYWSRRDCAKVSSSREALDIGPKWLESGYNSERVIGDQLCVFPPPQELLALLDP